MQVKNIGLTASLYQESIWKWILAEASNNKDWYLQFKDQNFGSTAKSRHRHPSRWVEHFYIVTMESYTWLQFSLSNPLHCCRHVANLNSLLTVLCVMSSPGCRSTCHLSLCCSSVDCTYCPLVFFGIVERLCYTEHLKSSCQSGHPVNCSCHVSGLSLA